MTVKERINSVRTNYVLKYHKEPSSIILGYELILEFKNMAPSRRIEAGVDLFGMKVIIDANRPTRCEVGDLIT